MSPRKKRSQPTKTDVSVGPVSVSDPDAVYTLELLVKLTGIASPTILHYQELGLIARIAPSGRGVSRFNDEALRALRRIEHLRIRYGMNLHGLKLTLKLLDEVERLRDHLRSRQ